MFTLANIFIYIFIGVCWMVFHSAYLNKVERQEGSALYPVFMIFAWPIGIIMYGITKIFRL